MKVNILSKKFLPVVIISVLGLLAFIALNNPPEAARKSPATGARISVETIAITEVSYQIILNSYGTVQPRTRSMLMSQVGGQVIWVNPQFSDGGTFSAGTPLLRLDNRDYLADVKIAEATLLDAQQALAEEEALSSQALADWQRLSNKGSAPDLVLRKPQLMAAQARVISAQASLTKAMLNLERTEITAPFAGRILEKQVDLGQVVASNSTLAEIYATDYVEVRLPLRNRDLAFVNLPSEHVADSHQRPSVRITSHLGHLRFWPARLVRTESSIDPNAQQLHVVAQIDNPFNTSLDNTGTLKIGEYVTAEIDGITLEKAIVIPNRSIYQGSYVYVVEEGLLMRRNIEIRWQNETDAIIASGLSAHEQLVITSLGQVISGTRVNVLSTKQNPVSPVTTGKTNRTAQKQTKVNT